MLNLKKNLNIFFISSFASIITFLYIGNAFNKKKRPSDVPFEAFAVSLPILYGIFGLINYYITKKYGNNYSIIVGIVFGLLLSSIGRFKLNLPVKLFDFTPNTSYKVHIIAAILYAFIFRFIITPIINFII